VRKGGIIVGDGDATLGPQSVALMELAGEGMVIQATEPGSQVS
jgi:hypothetical protein